MARQRKTSSPGGRGCSYGSKRCWGFSLNPPAAAPRQAKVEAKVKAKVKAKNKEEETVIELASLNPDVVYSTQGGGFGDHWLLCGALLQASELHGKPFRLRRGKTRGEPRPFAVDYQEYFDTQGEIVESDSEAKVVFFSRDGGKNDLERLMKDGYDNPVPERIIPWNYLFEVPLAKTRKTHLGLRSRVIAYQFRARSRKDIKECAPGEEDRFLEEAALAGYRTIEVGKHVPLDRCLEVLSWCEFYVGIDTGPTHLALNVGAPTWVVRNGADLDFTYKHRNITALPRLGDAGSLLTACQPQKKASFLVPCKNRLEFAKQTLPLLDFFVGQGHEVIFVDYDCPQRSGEWVKSNHPGVTVIEVKDKKKYNAGEARNLAAAAARNDWLCWMDCDIKVHPNFLAELCRLEKGQFLFFAKNDLVPRRGMGGLMACSRDAYYEAGGYSSYYDEYGGKDIEFKYRLFQNGEEPLQVNPLCVEHVPHPDHLRVQFYDKKNRRLAIKDSNAALKQRMRHFAKRNEPPPWQLNYDKAEYSQFFNKVIVKQLSLHVTDHCNFNCIGCNHASPYYEPNNLDPVCFSEPLQKLGEFCYAKEIHLVGGEPFLHPDLYGFIRSIKESNKVSDFIRLYTNGFWLSERGLLRHAPVLDQIDALHVSMHPESPGGEVVEQMLRTIKKKHHIVAQKHRNDRFYKVGFRESPAGRGSCPVKKCMHLLPDGRLVKCAVAGYYAPKSEDVTKGFMDHSGSAFYDVSQGNCESFAKWYNGMAQCCRFCGYAEDSIPYVGRVAGVGHVKNQRNKRVGDG